MPKLLFVRFSSIGDIVLTSPLLRCAKNQIKNVEIHFLTFERNKTLLDNNPHLDLIHTWEQTLKTNFHNLKDEKYDAIIDLHKNFRSLRLKLNLWNVHTYDFNKLNLEKYLTVQFKINCLPKKHIVDRYFEALKKFNVKNDHRGLEFFIHPEGNLFKEKLPSSFFANNYIALCIGAQHYTKRLPKEKLKSLVQKINQPILLIGGIEDQETGKFVAEGENHVFNACGMFDIHQSAAAVSLSKYVITHDTGMMHIAAALGKSIVTVWGNTIPEFGMYAYRKNERQQINNMEVEPLKCRPCSKIGYQSCPKGHFKCMNLQNLDEIANIVSQ